MHLSGKKLHSEQKNTKENNLTMSVFGRMIPVYDIIRVSRADEDAQSVKA